MFAVILSASSVRAQAPPGPLPPRPGAKVQTPPAQIKVRVDMVSTPVTVRNAAGEMVLSLEQSDFRVFDNGVEQKVEHFDMGGEPLSAVLVFETSSRIEALLPAVRRTGILFTQTVLGPAGQAAVLGYDDTSTLLAPFTSNHDQIEKAVSGLRLGLSGAALYDTMGQAVSMLSEQPDRRRRVLVVVGEAVDTGSQAKLGEVLRAAQLANITIYTVGLSTTAAQLRAKPEYKPPISATPPGTFGLPPIPGTPQTPSSEERRHGNIDLLALAKWIVERAANLVADSSLEVATVATGGMHISTFKDESIEKAIDRIGEELHAQYSLGYRPAGVPANGFHDIKVQITRPGLSVRARPGYYLAPPEN